MRNTSKYLDSIFDSDPSAVICFYNINLKEKGEYLFHAGENGYKKPIVFGGKVYDFFPIMIEGFDIQGDGRLPRPRMTFGNSQGVVSLRLDYFKNFINHKVTRIKTFIKFLDDENFPNNKNPYGATSSDVTFQEEIYFVNEKIIENDSVIEFELVSLLELQNATVPNRKVYSNHCPWKYRSESGCGYTGAPIADQKNKRFIDKGYNLMTVGKDVYFNAGEFDETKQPVEWDIYSTYNKGDIVEITPFDYDPIIKPKAIYVCVENNTESFPPRDPSSWVLDECDKTICGCKLRFSDVSKDAGAAQRKGVGHMESENGIPFGGFPGVDPYDF